MLIHVAPTIFNPYSDVNVALVDVNVPEFSLKLVGGIDVVSRKPYPNKSYNVVCRKVGRKAINGILVKVDENVRDFSVITRWSFNAERIIQHTVNYSVLDNEYECVTDEPSSWHAFGNGKYKNRWPYENKIPNKLKPTMTILYQDEDTSRDGDVKDIYEEGWLVYRLENLAVPTVEKERLFGDSAILERMPLEKHAFDINTLV